MNSPYFKSLVVVVVSLVSTAIHAELTRHFHTSFVGILYPTTFLIAWKYGYRYALATIVLLSMGFIVFSAEPIGEFKMLHSSDLVRLSIYLITANLTSWIVCRSKLSEENRVITLSSLSDLRNRFRRSAEAINLGVWYCDLPFDKLIWDDVVKDHFWLPRESDVTIDIFFERIHPDDRARTKEAIEYSNNHRAPYDIIYRTTNPKDTSQVKYIRAIGWTDYDESGKPIRFDGVTFDNTHIRKVSTDLKDSLDVLETINSVGRNLSAELDQKKLVQQVTDAATQLSKAEFGAFFYNLLNEKGETYTLYTVSGVPMENFTKFPMPRKTDIFAMTFDGVGILRSDDITKDPRYGHNLPNHGMPAGHLPVVSYLAVPVKSRSGEVIGGLFLGHKEKGVFTEREEKIVVGLAAQIAVAMDNARLFEKAHEAVRIRDEFLSISSHELRTPLTSLKMQLQLFSHLTNRGETVSPAQIQKIVEVSERQVGRLNSLVEDLLDVTRISSGKLSLKVETVDLVELIREIEERYLPLIEKNNSSLEIHVPEKLYAEADRIRIEQVIINLLTNAIRYAPGSKIEIRVAEEAAMVCVRIKDNGPGIAAEDHPRIFQRFERVSSRSGQVGLGLGLYIVQQIAEAHGGKVILKSEKDKGAEFIVRFPAKGGTSPLVHS